MNACMTQAQGLGLAKSLLGFAVAATVLIIVMIFVARH